MESPPIYPTGIEDLDRLILLEKNGEELLSACSADKRSRRICDNYFWYQKYIKTYGTRADLGSPMLKNGGPHYKNIYLKSLRSDYNTMVGYAGFKGYNNLLLVLFEEHADPDSYLEDAVNYGFYGAVRGNQIGTLKFIIDYCKKNGLEEYPWRADGLTQAIKYGALASFWYLVEDLRLDGDDLENAVEYGQIGIIRAILEVLEKRNRVINGTDAVMAAINNNNFENFRLLTNSPYVIFDNEEIKIGAITYGRLEILDYIVNNILNVAENDLDDINYLIEPKIEIIAYLVDHGAVIKDRNVRKAVTYGWTDTVAWLLDNSEIDPSLFIEDAINWHRPKKTFDMLKILFDRRAKPSEGILNYLLRQAISYNFPDIAALLLDAGADILSVPNSSMNINRIYYMARQNVDYNHIINNWDRDEHSQEYDRACIKEAIAHKNIDNLKAILSLTTYDIVDLSVIQSVIDNNAFDILVYLTEKYSFTNEEYLMAERYAIEKNNMPILYYLLDKSNNAEQVLEIAMELDNAEGIKLITDRDPKLRKKMTSPQNVKSKKKSKKKK